MSYIALFRKTLPLGLAFVLYLGIAQAIAAEQGQVISVNSLAAWGNVKVWNFDVPQDIEEWERRDESDSDGGEYLWAESPVTYTTGTQSVVAAKLSLLPHEAAGGVLRFV